MKLSFDDKPPKQVSWDVVISPGGQLVVGWNDQGQLCCSSYLKKKKSRDLVAEWQKRWPKTIFIKSKLKGDFKKRNLLLVGSEFQFKVLNSVMKIPKGTVTSFGKLAEVVGKPGASRAVGAACTNNPLRYFIPCYRVLGSGGSLRDSASGPEVQRSMLESEGYKFAAQKASNKVKKKRVKK